MTLSRWPRHGVSEVKYICEKILAEYQDVESIAGHLKRLHLSVQGENTNKREVQVESAGVFI